MILPVRYKMQKLGVISSPLIWILTEIIFKQLMATTPTPTPTPLCITPSQHNKCNVFYSANHRKRKVVGGKHIVLVHFVDASAPDPSGVVI